MVWITSVNNENVTYITSSFGDPKRSRDLVFDFNVSISVLLPLLGVLVFFLVSTTTSDKPALVSSSPTSSDITPSLWRLMLLA